MRQAAKDFQVVDFYSAPVRVRCIVTNRLSVRRSVCVCVCLSVREHISGTARPLRTKFCMQIPSGRGSVLLRWRCVTLCTSGFVDDVTFGHNGREAGKGCGTQHRPWSLNPWMDRGIFPLLFEVEGTPCVLSSGFFGGKHFCTNAHGIHFINGAIFVKFSQLIRMKIIKIVATRCQILRQKCTKFNFGWGSDSDPADRAYSAPRLSSWI